MTKWVKPEIAETVYVRRSDSRCGVSARGSDAPWCMDETKWPDLATTAVAVCRDQKKRPWHKDSRDMFLCRGADAPNPKAVPDPSPTRRHTACGSRHLSPPDQAHPRPVQPMDQAAMVAVGGDRCGPRRSAIRQVLEARERSESEDQPRLRPLNVRGQQAPLPFNAVRAQLGEPLGPSLGLCPDGPVQCAMGLAHIRQ